jgi:hypothetical protein
VALFAKLGLAVPREHRERRRLARRVRAHARAERERYHRAGVIEFDSIAVRTALYEQIARRLDESSRPLAESGLDQLESLLAEPPPVRDYGPRAAARNERIASVLADLEEHSRWRR